MSNHKRIAIIGGGVVGKGMERLFSSRFETKIFDIKEGYDQKEVNQYDLGIICVPTDTDESVVESVVAWLETPLTLIKSTVAPGTTDALSKKYGKLLNFSPEYMGESTYFTPYWKYPDPKRAETHTFVIVGGPDASEILDYFQEVMSVDTHYVAVKAIEAELAKFAENTFFATKVTFCNELAYIAKAFGVDYKKLRELWLLDSRINPNHTLVFPDKPGFGGKCLPKDLRAFIKSAESKGLDSKFLKAVWNRNLEFVLNAGIEKHGNPEWAKESNYYPESAH